MKHTLLAVFISFCISSAASAAPDFAKDIQPILQEKCIDCHAAPYKKGARLRVDTRENIVKAGESEEAGVVPKDAAKSQFYKRIILPEDHDDIMPPKGDPLTLAQQKLIKDWIDAGAPWSKGVVLKRNP